MEVLKRPRWGRFNWLVLLVVADRLTLEFGKGFDERNLWNRPQQGLSVKLVSFEFDYP